MQRTPNLGQGRSSPVCWIRELLASALVLYEEVFMPSLSGNFRYALRQFRLSPVFTAAAVLTLALGIGGTTAIFTLIHAVMLRSLPVSDPGRLYRVGEGDECCVEGGPQDRWGFYSFPLYERLKTETPEFEDVAAFQAGNWLPVQQEPMIDGKAALLNQPVSAWLRMMGRLRPGASIAGMGPRLTGVLRRWMQYDPGYPANWMADVIRTLPKQVINVVPAGAGVAVMKEEYGRSLEILLAVCGLVLLTACANVANLLLARAVARRGQTAVRLAIGASRRQIIAQALAESVLLAVGGGLAGLLVAVAAARLLLTLAFHSAHFLPVSPMPSLAVLAFAFALALVTAVIFGAVPAWFATRTDPAEALRGAGRSTQDRSSLTRKALLVVQATLAVVLVAGATM